MSNQFKKLPDWEEGITMPTYRQLESLSDKLKCPIAVFFFPSPPELEPIRNSFRTLPDAEYELMPPSVRIILRKAKAMQLNLAELNQETPISKRKLLRDLQFTADTPLERIADEIRQYLNVPLREQIAWKDVSDALEHWRHIFSLNGIFVFKDAFKADEYSGFCLYDPDFPIIFLNNSNSKTRQIFTLFHELAHLIFRTSGIDKIHDGYIDYLRKDEKLVEMLCNRFASVFLVPDSKFETLIQDIEIDEQEIKNLAYVFKVSPEVVLRKFLDKGLVSQIDYESLTEGWRAQFLEFKKNRKPGGDAYYTRISYLGKDYVDLALTQYHQNRIDSLKLSDFLNIKPKHLEKFQDKFLGGGI
ncbi:MAG: ImmA/IrrE family metallo-endopeptidase [Reichenbachiella sp.]|uniref:ImmA/IrrE family metallo-endopeptidase n=1 Tax=Reichenbachiella sp. TaxID=2184521 RepID=UPI0032641E63